VKVDDDLDLAQLAPLGCSLETGAGGANHCGGCERGSPPVGVGARSNPPLNPGDGDPVKALLELTGGIGAQYVVETSVRLSVLEQAMASLSSAGTCVVIGAPPLGSRIAVDVPNLLARGIRLVGTNQGDSNPRQFIPRLIELHRQGLLPFDRLIRRYAFDQINAAAQDAAAARTIKPVMILPA
jgi:aryl-alcohol dehydrogenase